MRVALAILVALAVAACNPSDAARSSQELGQRCVDVPGVIDAIRWAPDGSNVLVGTTGLDGSVGVSRIDASTLEVRGVVADPGMKPAEVDAGDDDSIYYGRLGDSGITRSANGQSDTIESGLVDWSHLTWTRPSFVVATTGPARSSIVQLEPAAAKAAELYRITDRIDSVWASASGDTIVVSHAPYPEDDPDAGSSIVVLRDGTVANEFAGVRGAVRVSASLWQQAGALVYVNADTFELGALALSGPEPALTLTNVDMAEVSEGGSLATATHLEDPNIDRLCLQGQLESLMGAPGSTGP